MKLLIYLLAALCGRAMAAEVLPNLPPVEVVSKVLRSTPLVQAADRQIQVEEANRSRLEAGSHEWNVRFGGQQRKSTPALGPGERFSEWNVALERPLRMPGKAVLDADLGASGVALADTAAGDVLHETSRNLLKSWFTWLKEQVAVAQWGDQLALLDKQVRSVQRRQQLGDAARLETVQAEAALAQAEVQLAQAHARLNATRADLNRRFPDLPLGEPGPIADPLPIVGDENEWIEAIVSHSHEFELAREQTRKARISAERANRDRLPDPTVGMHVYRERGGEEHVVGAFISIPLPGQARRAASEAAVAQVEVAALHERSVRQKIIAEAAALYHTATAAISSWRSGRQAADRLHQAANMMARAYQLGEGSLSDLLAARRLAGEAGLASRLAQLDALELRYRLLLDAHQLWPLDDHGDH